MPKGQSIEESPGGRLPGRETFHQGEYASTNLLYCPADNLMFGAEVLWGQKTVIDGTSGDNVSVQVSAKSSFGITL